MKRRTAYLLLLLAVAASISMVLVGRRLSIFHVEAGGGLFARLMVFDRFGVEAISVAILAILLCNGVATARMVGYLLVVTYLVLLTVQTGAVMFGGEFLSPLALENLTHLEFFLTVPNLLGVAFVAAVLALLVWLIETRSVRVPYGRQLARFAGILLIVGLALQQSRLWLPGSVLADRRALLMERNFAHTSPMLSLYRVLAGRVASERQNLRFSDFEIMELARFGFTLKEGHDYPFLKSTIYDGEPAFGEVEGDQPPNVILLFGEGVSARSLGVYGSHLRDLTPHIDDFARGAMVVDGFYNHTAASYRGMKGQLCSIFPNMDGVGADATAKEKVARYLCLNHLFRDRGYQTEFYNSHTRDHSYVDEMMAALGFETILNAEEISSEYLADDPPKLGIGLSDVQFFEGLIRHLEGRSQLPEKRGMPLFLAMYNIQTHANVDTTDDGVAYGDGRNNALNTIHNYDSAFGRFWKWFKKSSYAGNTVFIFTADHCHYSESSFVKVFKGGGYQELFIDRVPLIIYDGRRKLPARYDVSSATSIDLAPSIAHFVGLPNRQNPFFGTSVFDDSSKYHKDVGVAGYDGNFYVINKGFIHGRGNSESYSNQLDLIGRYIQRSHQLEVQDRIWPGNDSKLKVVP